VGITRSVRTTNGGNKREDPLHYARKWEVDLIQFLNHLVCGRDIVVASLQAD
jgi:hypothetical protein